MAESEDGIELNSLDGEKEKKDFEKELKVKIQYGDVDEISRITPKDLTECKSNALFTAMKMTFELRQRADKKGPEPDEDEFNKIAQSVDEFTCSLLTPLKSNTERRRVFADSLDDVMDTAIELEQKKVNKHVLISL
ncbi:hypothetical protein OS493_024602 [Desmophyllum pertusum]|uniref:Uncharacterized protein n=1 Tax=Desmophyllum pertusum TaxID=174260 RepID=A0A9X0A2S9_9CNID|nr:hypothetical protein OS493_024602 [Desmophyllum pertusum]